MSTTPFDEENVYEVYAKILVDNKHTESVRCSMTFRERECDGEGVVEVDVEGNKVGS